MTFKDLIILLISQNEGPSVVESTSSTIIECWVALQAMAEESMSLVDCLGELQEAADKILNPGTPPNEYGRRRCKKTETPIRLHDKKICTTQKHLPYQRRAYS